MKEHPKYLLVDSQILPEVYLKVILAKKLLAQGKAKSASEAAKSAGISRSAFYKYKDFIHEYNTRLSDSIMTISASLADESGVLSALMAEISSSGGNILTIHQSIPINGVATLTLSVDILPGEGDAEAMVETIEQSEGIHYLKILGRE